MQWHRIWIEWSLSVPSNLWCKDFVFAFNSFQWVETVREIQSILPGSFRARIFWYAVTRLYFCTTTEVLLSEDKCHSEQHRNRSSSRVSLKEESETWPSFLLASQQWRRRFLAFLQPQTKRGKNKAYPQMPWRVCFGIYSSPPLQLKKGSFWWLRKKKTEKHKRIYT